MKKIFALLLALCLLPAMAACGGAGKTVVGTWNSKVDLKEYLGSELGEMGDYLQSVDVEMKLVMNENKTFVMELDATAVIPAMKDAMMSYMTDMLDSMGMTADQFEAAYGSSLEAVVEETIQEMDTTGLNETISGTYTEENGKLILSANGTDNTGSWEDDELSLDLDDYGQLTFTRG